MNLRKILYLGLLGISAVKGFLINKDILGNVKGEVLRKIETDEHYREIGVKVVKGISSMLPKVDNIGHNILHANNEFINDILNNNMIDHDTQKFIILSSIKLAQYGDDMGSSLLQLYYDIVEKSL
tara:strand:+ start:496 stop:870 length:375 start_codon:yes stop_codon:yes gene_type:complete